MSTMFGDKFKDIPEDSSRVNIDDAAEVRYWTEMFRCSRGQLVMAVAKVGISVDAVKAELKRRS